MKRLKHIPIRKKRHIAKAELKKEVEKTLLEELEESTSQEKH